MAATLHQTQQDAFGTTSPYLYRFSWGFEVEILAHKMQSSCIDSLGDSTLSELECDIEASRSAIDGVRNGE